MYGPLLAVATFLGSIAPGREPVGPVGPDSSGPVAPVLDSADLERWLDGLVPYALTAGDIAGAVVLVIKGDRVLVQKGYGYADRAKRIPVDPERTLFAVGSVSKLFTWTAVMQQVQRGALDLDRDVNQYLDFVIPEAFGKPITLRHLMTHSAGFEERSFRRYARPRALAGHLRGTSVPDRIYPPGEVMAYSNYGSMVAGYIVERVSGEPFVSYIEKHVFEPLEMIRSTFRRPLPERFRADISRDYGRASDVPREPDDLDYEEPAGDPSGHLVTSAPDIARFMLAHLHNGRHGEHQLLDSATTALMHAPTFRPLEGARPVTLGFFRTDVNGHRIISHAGSIAGFHADLQLLPDDEVGLFFALNSKGEDRGLMGAGLMLQTAVFRRFMDRYFPAPAVPEEPTAPTAKEHARLVAGEYRMSRRPVGDFMEATQLFALFTMKLGIEANEDGTITTPGFLDFEYGRPRTWREVGPFQWRQVGGDTRLDFEVEGGQVKGWLPRDLYSFVVEPVPALQSARLNVPLLVGAVAVLVLGLVLWPLSALVGRRYGAAIELGPRERRAVWLRRAAILVGLMYLAGWILLLGAGAGSRDGLDPWIRLVQAVGLLTVLAAAAAVWSAWVSATGRQSAWVKLGSALTALAMVELVWFSFAFNLISARLNY